MNLTRFSASVKLASETKEIPAAKKEAPPPAPSKRAPPAKAPAKPLPQLMEEDVIPSLKATLETQEDLSDIELSFQDNKVLFLLHICEYMYGFYT